MTVHRGARRCSARAARHRRPRCSRPLSPSRRLRTFLSPYPLSPQPAVSIPRRLVPLRARDPCGLVTPCLLVGLGGSCPGRQLVGHSRCTHAPGARSRLRRAGGVTHRRRCGCAPGDGAAVHPLALCRTRRAAHGRGAREQHAEPVPARRMPRSCPEGHPRGVLGPEGAPETRAEPAQDGGRVREPGSGGRESGVRSQGSGVGDARTATGTTTAPPRWTRDGAEAGSW